MLSAFCIIFLHSGHKKDEMESDRNTKGFQEKGLKEKDVKRKGCGEEMRGTVFKAKGVPVARKNMRQQNGMPKMRETCHKKAT